MQIIINISNYYLILFLVISLFGCASVAPPDPHLKDRNLISTIYVSVGDFAPSNIASNNANPSKSTLTGGGAGAAPGALLFTEVAPVCFSPYSGPACAVFIPLFSLLTVGGGAIGASSGKSTGEMQLQTQHDLAEALKKNDAQMLLVTKILEYAKNETTLVLTEPSNDTHQPDAKLEVALLEIDSINSKKDMFLGGIFSSFSSFTLTINARAILKRTTDNVVLGERTYRYLSAPLTPQQWTEKRGETLIEEIEQGYKQIAEWMVDDFFLSQYNANRLYPKPIDPIVKPCASFSQKKCSVSWYEFLPVSSLRPTLRWEFAKNSENSSTTTITENSKIRYEVRIYPAIKSFDSNFLNKGLIPLSTPIYVRNNLDSDSHTLEESLQPCSDYMWTVRAIIEGNGSKRASDWSGTYDYLLDLRYFLAFKPRPNQFREYVKKDPLMMKHDWDSIEKESRLLNYSFPFSTPCDSGETLSSDKNDISALIGGG